MRATLTSTTASDIGEATATPADRRRFFDELVESGRFCRDTSLGAIFHPGSVSLREVSDGDSLHVCIDGRDRVSVHVDRFSPVAGACPDGSCRYSLGAVLAHVAAHISAQFRRLLRGARGQHRCRLECELVEVDETEAEAAVEAALVASGGPGCSAPAGSAAAGG